MPNGTDETVGCAIRFGGARVASTLCCGHSQGTTMVQEMKEQDAKVQPLSSLSVVEYDSENF